MMDFIQQELASLKTAGLLRELRTISKSKGSKVVINGREYINFCSNNYLGLADHPKVIEKSLEIIKEFGFGAGASRLISGNTIIHEELENRLAEYTKREAAIVFSTGYMANLGAITSLLDDNDTVIIDRLNHASIIDACRLSKAKLQVYPHKDMAALAKILIKSDKFKNRLIVTDRVFSMDGDIAPVLEIVQLAKEHKAMAMTDQAHAVGLEQNENIDIIMGTLSKTFGSLGGYIAGSQKLIDFLKNKARSFIYTTGLPPAACAAAIAALDVIKEDKSLVPKLRQNSDFLQKEINKLGLDTMDSETQIIPIMIGEADQTMTISKALFDKGIFISGIRPPTVPKGQSRLRISVSAAHTMEEMKCLVSSLQELTQK